MGAFDTQRPPQQELVDDCVHCGFCLDACPTYVLWAEEADSPRGRIVLIDEGLGGADEISGEMATHFDRCLGCMACVTACPSGVRYDRLIERVRPQVERHHRRPPTERALRRLLFETLPHPRRLRGARPDARRRPQARRRAAAGSSLGDAEGRAAHDGAQGARCAADPGAHPRRRRAARPRRAPARLRPTRVLPRRPPGDDRDPRRRGL